jgi:hypothetical protein
VEHQIGRGLPNKVLDSTKVHVGVQLLLVAQQLDPRLRRLRRVRLTRGPQIGATGRSRAVRAVSHPRGSVGGVQHLLQHMLGNFSNLNEVVGDQSLSEKRRKYFVTEK